MEDIIGSEDDEDVEDIKKVDAKILEDEVISPSQPVLLSQKQSLKQDAMKQSSS